MNQPTSPLPKITVITPSLNQGRFLEQSIQSVLSQGYPNLEYLLMDGGSTDETSVIIQKYANQFTYWVSEPDQGQSDAINKGFTMANGELVTWLNADDYFLDGALFAAAAAYHRNTHASFYFGDGLRVDETGQRKSNFWEGEQPRFDRAALIYGLNYILQPAAFINRAVLEQVGYLDPNLHYGMDTDLWIRLSGAAAPVALSNVLAASREYGQTKTSSGSFARIEELRRIHTGYADLPITPGVICYFLDTLHRLTEARPDAFPETYRRDLLTFWQSSAALMARYGARPDGRPLPAGTQPAEFPDARPGLLHRTARALLRRARSLFSS